MVLQGELRTQKLLARAAKQVRAPAQHGLSSNTMALITSDCDKNARPGHQIALTTSDCAPEQEAELLRVHLAETHAAHTEIHSRQGTAFRLRFHYLSSLRQCLSVRRRRNSELAAETRKLHTRASSMSSELREIR